LGYGAGIAATEAGSAALIITLSLVQFAETSLYQLARIRGDERFTPEAARAMAQKIVQACERLERFP
jgi:hypothetical protein